MSGWGGLGWASSLALVFLLHIGCVTWQAVTWFPIVDKPAHLAGKKTYG